MSSWRQQALIEAPVEEVWEYVADPAKYPLYASGVIDVTGVPQEIEQGTNFQQLMKNPIGRASETTFVVDELDDLREIKMRCTVSGYYSRWLLTKAQENTFVDLEIGMEPTGVPARAFDSTVGKRWYRRLADDSLDGLKRLLNRPAYSPRGR